MREIKYYRLVRGYTQTQLADEVGIGQPKISELENGIIKVGEDVLRHIAELLKFPQHFTKLTDLHHD